MRTRDWRRAQREKRTKAAYNRAVDDFNDDQVARSMFPRYRGASWQDTLRSFMRNEGRNWNYDRLRWRECGKCSRIIGHCECYGSNTRRRNEAMAYDLREGDWEEYAEWDMYGPCDDEHQCDWHNFDYDVPLLKRVADFSLSGAESP